MMKRRFLTLAVSLILLFVSVLSYAQDFEIDGICYSVNGDNTVEVVKKGFSGYSGDIVIPSEVSGFRVTGIGENPTIVPASPEVSSVSYYDIDGNKSKEPVEGVNIVVTTYSNGSFVSTKEIFTIQ